MRGNSSQTHSNFNARSNSFSNRGTTTYGTLNGYENSYTKGTIECETLRQQAIQQANANSNARIAQIETNSLFEEAKFTNYYFDSTTIFPNTLYEAGFQILLSKEVERELEYLIISIDLGVERHVFYFDCGENVKKWYLS